MKKVIALVLALVLALSMAVSAFAVELVPMDPQLAAPKGRTPIKVIDADDTFLHVYHGGKYYVALEDMPWEDVVVTANGCVSAKLIDFNPDEMVVLENIGTAVEPNWVDMVDWAVSCKGEVMENSIGITYDEACEKAASLNADGKVTYYAPVQITNVFVIEIVVEDNYTAHFDKGTIEIDANLTIDGKKIPFAGEIVVINDVIIFEYEQVKWTAENCHTHENGFLFVGDAGYSDWFTDEHGYSNNLDGYDELVNRAWKGAAVVSTTAFRAIEGEDLWVVAEQIKEDGEVLELNVLLENIQKDQKGVNFLGYIELDYVDEDRNGAFDYDKENLTAIDFGFYGDQIVKGDYTVMLYLSYDWYQLREMFGKKVEEEDIITYYVYDENGNPVGAKEVDYMTDDLSKNVEFDIELSNGKLGQYTLSLKAPAVEEEVESNPNTGAESVVGVVAALAVVSVATAAAVSLKK